MVLSSVCCVSIAKQQTQILLDEAQRRGTRLSAKVKRIGTYFKGYNQVPTWYPVSSYVLEGGA